jgi:MOSC domain-containing protein YiiM
VHHVEGWLGQPGWLKRFFEARRPGAYLPVIDKGRIRAGDDIEVVFRPQHDVTVALAFRAFTTERELLPQLAVAEALPDEAKALLRNRTRQDGEADASASSDGRRTGGRAVCRRP